MTPLSTKALTIASWNVNGIRARANAFTRWIYTYRPDIVCLQEIKAHPEQVPLELKHLEDYVSYWHGAYGGYSGVSIHLKRSSVGAATFTVPFFDEETRILQADVDTLSIINVYVPLGQKNFQQKLDFLDALARYVDALHYNGRSVLLCGDLNVAHTDNDVHPEMLDEGALCIRPEERQRIDALVQIGLVDLFRVYHPRLSSAYSWWPYFGQARAKNVGWRIDYIFASQKMKLSLEDCRIHKEEASSDHSPVIARFRGVKE